MIFRNPLNKPFQFASQFRSASQRWRILIWKLGHNWYLNARALTQNNSHNPALRFLLPNLMHWFVEGTPFFSQDSEFSERASPNFLRELDFQADNNNNSHRLWDNTSSSSTKNKFFIHTETDDGLWTQTKIRILRLTVLSPNQCTANRKS